MFGELIGAALTDVWRRAGSPPGVRYVELGRARHAGARCAAGDALRRARPAAAPGRDQSDLRERQAALLGPGHPP
jgi:hypothetical protein